MFIVLLNMEENRELGNLILKNFTLESLVPVVEGMSRFAPITAKVTRLFEEEGELVAELSEDIHLEEGSFEAITYSVSNNKLRHIGILRSISDFAFEGQDFGEYESYMIEAAGGVSSNKKGISHANSLISSGKVDMTSSWDFSASDSGALLKGNNWGDYSKWFLGVRPGTKPQTKEHYAYPFGKNGKVYRRAVIAAKSRSAQQGHATINASATRLLERIDKRRT